MKLNYSENTSTKNVIEYLIAKLESRAKFMKKIKLATIAISDMKDFIDNKNSIAKTFSEIENDLIQGSSALKVLNLQNRDLSEQLAQFYNGVNFKAEKEILEEKIIKELIEKNESLLQENSEMKKILVDKDNIINQLTEAVNILEEKFNINKNLFTSNLEENNQFEFFNDEKTREGEIRNNENIKVEENLKNLIEEKENNKILMNEKIKGFFKKNSNNSLKNNDKVESQYIKNFHLQDLILDKISNSDELLIFITKTYGNDFMHKLLNQKLDDEYLLDIDEAMNNYEAIKSMSRGGKGKPLHSRTFSDIKEEPEESSEYRGNKTEEQHFNSLKRSLQKSHTATTSFERSNSVKVIPKKKFSGGQSADKIIKMYNHSLGLGRKFIAKTASGGFFDKGIAYGGVSKLEYSDTIRKRNIKIK
jgi:hypothetical protein